EIVDVLRDHAVELAEPPQGDEGQVPRVRLRPPDDRERGASELPVAPPARLAPDEVLERELARVEAVPHSARAPEVGNAGLGADPRPGEDDDAAGALDQRGEPLDGSRGHERRFAFLVARRRAGARRARLGPFPPDAALRRLVRLAAYASFRLPTPPRTRGPRSMVAIHAASSAASSG